MHKKHRNDWLRIALTPWCGLMLCVFVMGLWPSAGLAQVPAPSDTGDVIVLQEDQSRQEGEAALSALVARYHEVQQYQATMKYTADQKTGRWVYKQEGEIYVAFDRARGMLKIDRPDMVMLVKEGKMYLENTGFWGDRYLVMEMEGDLNYQALMRYAQVRGVPILSQVPYCVDVAFLLSDEPVSELAEYMVSEVKKMAVKGKADVTVLHLPMVGEDLLLRVDEKTGLLRQVRFEADMFEQRKSQFRSDSYLYKDVRVNQPMDEDMFAFVTEGRVGFSSLEALWANMEGKEAPAEPKKQGLVEKEAREKAPDFELKDLEGEPVRLADLYEAHEIVVLDFWATWCPPCQQALPGMQAFADASKDKGVKVVAVNVAEQSWEAAGYWEDAGYSMDVLLDEQGEVFGVFNPKGTLPHTVVIYQGEVAGELAGFRQGQEEQLGAMVETLKRASEEVEKAGSLEAAKSTSDEAVVGGEEVETPEAPF
ncbi:TlpA family protein disulfide reductase [Poriferisphaera sp. WC338]|uniref:TlpA family protein disulfide reductase n=1 Tax=Poriferisphaera sp. WC338 TaxID=3425129 RepID=UPI003D812B1A